MGLGDEGFFVQMKKKKNREKMPKISFALRVRRYFDKEYQEERKVTEKKLKRSFVLFLFFVLFFYEVFSIVVIVFCSFFFILKLASLWWGLVSLVV